MTNEVTQGMSQGGKRDHRPFASLMVTEPPYKSEEWDLEGEIRGSDRRAKGGRRNGSELPELHGCVMRQSLLHPTAMICVLWKAVCSETGLYSLGRE
jgi:hypothetical protein